MALGRDMDAREDARKRSALYVGLKPFLEEEQILEGLLLWEREFADGPVFALQGYITKLIQLTGLDTSRAEVHRSLVRALSLEMMHLPPDPRPRMEALARNRGLDVDAAPTGVSEIADWTVVFKHLHREFLERIARRDTVAVHKIRRDLVEALPKLEIAAACRQAVAQWLTDRQAELDARLGKREMHGILHATYVLACQYLGPVESDRLLSAAVQAVEALPEARRLPPRELL